MLRKILVVDDEVEFVDMVRMRLETSGYSVSAAYDGREALNKARDEKPALILLDVVMTLLDGFETLKRLKADLETKDIPIIMLTCKGESSSIFKAQDLGAADYIIKPFDGQELLDLVKKYSH